MNVPARLGLFGIGLALVFAVLFVAGRALVPDSTVAEWSREAKESEAGHESTYRVFADFYFKVDGEVHTAGFVLEAK